jgi:pimeloyl-ACP methyl ester carboxylesterase
MSIAIIDGLETNYEVLGSGPPLLMFAPGAFDATMDKWTNTRAWREVNAVDVLAEQCTVILYDRRESGESGGRVERLRWGLFARQAKGLLDALNIESAFLMGGCMGCSVAVAFAVDYPEATRGLVLHWPTGGYRWRANMLAKFRQHTEFVKAMGFDGVIGKARAGETFWTGSDAGPWGSAINREEGLAEQFRSQDMDRYLGIVATTGPDLYDRDTVPGCTAEEAMGIKAPALIIPGDDPSHATSGAHYLRECLPYPEFWDLMPLDQHAQSNCDKILEFCANH